jgi:hypothetical protein
VPGIEVKVTSAAALLKVCEAMGSYVLGIIAPRL